MTPIVIELSTCMEPIPVRSLRLIPVEPGVYQQTSQADERCAECARPMAEHYDTTGCILIGCPLHPPDPDGHLRRLAEILVEWLGADSTQNLLDYLDTHGTQDLRRQLATLPSVKGGR